MTSLKTLINSPRRLLLAVGILLFAFSCKSQDRQADKDWPQWMGPERNGLWQLDLDKESLNTGDLKKIWEVPVGHGYCGPTVADNRVYLMDYIGDSVKFERVLCFDAGSGEQVWMHTYKRPYPGIGYPTGPRASVLINESRAYSYGTMGDLHCFDAATGELIWHVSGTDEFDLEIPVWGLASSPLIEENLLIVQIAGRPDACLMAFDKKTGKKIWSALPDQASYSAPIVINQAGKRVLVCWTGDNLAGLDAYSGKLHWKVPFNRRGGIINISSPVYDAPYIFLSSFWDGSMLVELDQSTLEAKLVWERAGKNERHTDALHCCISTPLMQNGYIYGIDSYGEFRCLEMLTGNRIWTDLTVVPPARWANAHLVRQGNKIWAFNELGELILGTISPTGFTDLGRVALLKPVPVSPNPRGGVNWSHPAFSGRDIYARSDARLVCYKLLK